MADKKQLSIDELQEISGGFAVECTGIVGLGWGIICYGIIGPLIPKAIDKLK